MTIIRVYADLHEARLEILGRRALASHELPKAVRAKIRAVFGEDLSPAQVVERIVGDVRTEGDAAVRRYTRAIDGVEVDDLLVPQEELDAALRATPEEVRSALEVAAARVRSFHEWSLRTSWVEFADGGALGQLRVPLERVGVYAPGGRAAYPSTVVMAVVPARVAGVKQVVLATPPGKGGSPVPIILAAARIAGADQVYRVGGAQAIAALAFGTESIPCVDKIVGPGNIFVVLAKQAVAEVVGIDGAPGPTETVVIADDSANPCWVAADMLAQAEHDPLAQALLLCTSRALAEEVVAELERQIATVSRKGIIRESFAARGAIVLVESVEQALEFANEHAPEHLCLSVADPWRYLGSVRNAGGVFLGEESVEAVGDYTAGPSHIMPTGGTARFASPLNLDDFQKVISVFSFTEKQLGELGPPAIALARAEGLEAHAAAIGYRLQGTGNSGVDR